MSDDAIRERVAAVMDSVDAHEEATGHDEAQLRKYGRVLNVSVVVLCDDCGARLGTVSARSASALADAFEDVSEDTEE